MARENIEHKTLPTKAVFHKIKSMILDLLNIRMDNHMREIF